MKKILLSIAFFLTSCLAFSQGISWEPTIQGAFAKAKAQNKPVFVECFHPNCPICMSLEPTLKNAEVGKFYNQNFINYKLNLSDAKQVKFLSDKKIYLPGFPLFLYFDKNQNILHHTDPVNTPKDFVNHAKAALDPNTQSGKAWKRYQAGSRDVSMMASLAYLLRITQDTTRNINVANDLYGVYPKDKLSSQESWEIAKKCLMDVDNGFAEFWLRNLDTAKKYEAAKGHEGTEMNAMGMLVQMAIYSPKASKYSLAKVNKLKQYMNLIGAGQYVTSNTWQIEAQALIREQGQDKAMSFIQNMVSQTSQPQMLVYYVTFYNVNFPDGKLASQVRNWMNTALPQLKTPLDIANARYESARLYKKASDAAKAKQELTLAKTSLASAKAKATDANSKKVVENLGNSINRLGTQLN
ncbi:thioredoxin family protein [Emticicia fontis]